MKLTPAHCRFDEAELAYLRARAAAEERSVPWVVRRLVREAMGRRAVEHNEALNAAMCADNDARSNANLQRSGQFGIIPSGIELKTVDELEAMARSWGVPIKGAKP